MDQPPRWRALHGRRAQQFCRRSLERNAGRPHAARRARPRGERLGPDANDRSCHGRRAGHAVWRLSSDEARNRSALDALPAFRGSNHFSRIKPGATVLAEMSSTRTTGESAPAIVVQPFGRGRTMAMATGITRRWSGEFSQSWGGNDARYYKKLWRNIIYWLTENSSIGRRRLLAESDKRLYRPGETITLQARAFDENAAADARLSRRRDRRPRICKRCECRDLAAATSRPWSERWRFRSASTLERGI